MATKSIGTLKAALILDTRGFFAGFQKAGNAVKGATGDIGAMTGLSQSAFSSIAAGFAIVASAAASAVAVMKPAFESVDRQSKLAHRLNITGEAAQRFSAVAKATGVEVNSLAKAAIHMGKTIGTGGKSLDQRFIDVAVAVDAIEDPIARANRAAQIFGKEGALVLEAIGGSGSNIAGVSRTIDRFGLSISRLESNRVERANDAIGRLGVVYDGFREKLAATLAPAVEAWALGAMEAIDQLNKSLIGVSNSISLVGGSLKDSKSLLGGFGAALDVVASIEQAKAGGTGRLPDMVGGSVAKTVKPGAFERNSVEAVRAIQNAGGDGTSGIVTELKHAVRLLTVIADDARKDSLDKDGFVFREGRI